MPGEIATALAGVRERLARACQRAGRPVESVTLVAVSKLQPEAAIREAYAAGQRDFGENYAQELRDKARGLSDLADIRWHAIGPLQANKLKYVAPVASLFHAVDRWELAQQLSDRLQRDGRHMNVLVEVNVGGEDSKHGLPPGEVPDLVERARSLRGIRVVGLMCIPPSVEDAEQSRPFFRALRELGARVGTPELSMGMTSDFEVAVEEGATLVRVGTAIFGARPARSGAVA